MNSMTYNFELYQGNDDIYVLKFEETDNDNNKVNANLSGYSFVLTVKDSVTSPSKVQLTSEDANIKLGVLDSSGNFSASSTNPYAIQIHFPHEITEKMLQPKYVYDLFGIKSNGIRELLLKGELRVSRGVTYGGSTSTRHY